MRSQSVDIEGVEKMEPMAGIEPATDGLRNRCSTAELHWRPSRNGGRRGLQVLPQRGKPYTDGGMVARAKAGMTRRREAVSWKGMRYLVKARVKAGQAGPLLKAIAEGTLGQG